MSDLIERQKAIDALDELCDRECEYSKQQRSVMCGACHLGSAFDVIEQLPTAEPHTFKVIDTKTRKEADLYKIALKEEWAKGLCYCDMEGFAIEEDGTLMLLDECGNCAYCPEGRFEVEWDG